MNVAVRSPPNSLFQDLLTINATQSTLTYVDISLRLPNTSDIYESKVAKSYSANYTIYNDNLIIVPMAPKQCPLPTIIGASKPVGPQYCSAAQDALSVLTLDLPRYDPTILTLHRFRFSPIPEAWN